MVSDLQTHGFPNLKHECQSLNRDVRRKQLHWYFECNGHVKLKKQINSYKMRNVNIARGALFICKLCIALRQFDVELREYCLDGLNELAKNSLEEKYMFLF
jgi:hypothetical protein